VTSLIYAHAKKYFYVCHGLFMHVPRLIHMCILCMLYICISEPSRTYLSVFLPTYVSDLSVCLSLCLDSTRHYNQTVLIKRSRAKPSSLKILNLTISQISEIQTRGMHICEIRRYAQERPYGWCLSCWLADDAGSSARG